ncbi:hypothetical protein KM043_005305 [Ampulex compressa]|nr:hypothetical protein KM043_005305 [Ampulex compressa]
MLGCGRVVGLLPKVTRHTHANHFYRPLKYVGIIHVSPSWYSSNANHKKPYKPLGTTIKPEECVPESTYSKPKKTVPACESQPNGTCPPSCYAQCGPLNDSQQQSGQGGSGKNGKWPPYWKLLATLIIAGVTIYAISSTHWFTPKKENTDKDVSKKKQKRRWAQEKVKVPEKSSLIPQSVPYLLIGGGTAAFTAFRSIKSRDPTAKVLVIGEEENFPYMRPPLSKELWYNTNREISAQLHFKQWNGIQRSIFYEPHEFYASVNNLIQSDRGGVAVATGWKVSKINVMNKTVVLEDGYEIKYDKCLLATGASPKNIPVFESVDDDVRQKVSLFRTKDDFLELEENVHDPACKNIVIIGGGFLGSELACSLARNLGKEKKVFQIYKEKFIMSQILPEYLSEWTTKKAMLDGVNCIPNAEVEDFSYKDGKLSLVLTGGQTVEADQVIIAVGVKPNTDLAATSHLETDPKIGGFIVNAELEARSNLWVAGDAACFYDVKLGRRRVEHHDHAVVSGRLAGENMTGAGKPYLHQSMFWSDLGPDVGYEAIGIVDSSLPTVGVFAKATELDTPKAAVSISDEVARSSSEEKAPVVQAQSSVKLVSKSEDVKAFDENTDLQIEQSTVCSDTEEQTKKHNDFGKGIIFYLRDDIVVGIVLWNIFNRMSTARQVLARGTKYDDLNEVAKLFTIHDD